MTHTVLVVDDSAAMRAVIHATLRMAGYDVVEASDGQQALLLIDAQTVDLIVSDLNMPLMSGIAFVRAVRSRPQYGATPIFLLTVESSGAQIDRGRGAGATGWITKPADAESMLKIIAQALA